MKKNPLVPLQKEPRRKKFNFEEMKAEATHKDASVRKHSFIEYFEQFGEFPTYLFDNETTIDSVLKATIDDLLNDPGISKEMRTGIDTLLSRLAS
ncbi:MAG: hypothetical protein P4L81_04255 [Candidatus Pacebacteria bacterium]|nr:hypothetical protein [Candidatus Paceibacterota bacterium]